MYFQSVQRVNFGAKMSTGPFLWKSHITVDLTGICKISFVVIQAKTSIVLFKYVKFVKDDYLCSKLLLC